MKYLSTIFHTFQYIFVFPNCFETGNTMRCDGEFETVTNITIGKHLLKISCKF